ncbi:hypothetical protein L1887_47893 [Cichorium endivia]|nr:hypothetical protein L1887_47893 [Cichorium endivia]
MSLTWHADWWEECGDEAEGRDVDLLEQLAERGVLSPVRMQPTPRGLEFGRRARPPLRNEALACCCPFAIEIAQRAFRTSCRCSVGFAVQLRGIRQENNTASPWQGGSGVSVCIPTDAAAFCAEVGSSVLVCQPHSTLPPSRLFFPFPFHRNVRHRSSVFMASDHPLLPSN